MPGFRITCSYCSSSVLSRDYGKHVLKTHSEAFFVNTNLRDLHRDKHLLHPMPLMLDEQVLYCCFADNSFIKKETLADTHFKGKSEKHREAIMALRTKFPLVQNKPSVPGDASAPATAAAPAPEAELLTRREKRSIQTEMLEIIVLIKDYEKRLTALGQGHKCSYSQDASVIAAFSKLGIIYSEKKLREENPERFAEEEPEEEEEGF